MKGRSRRGANIYIYIYSVKWVSHWQPKLLQHQGLSQRQILTQRAQRRSDCFSTSLLLGVLSPSSNRSDRTAMACPHAWAQDDMASSLPTHGLAPKAMGDLTCKHLWCIDGCKITIQYTMCMVIFVVFFGFCEPDKKTGLNKVGL